MVIFECDTHNRDRFGCGQWAGAIRLAKTRSGGIPSRLVTGTDYAADVSALADLLLASAPAAPVFEVPESSGVYLLDLHISSSRSRELVAVQAALQLALDAATIAAIHPSSVGDIDAVAVLLEKPDLVLNLMWAGSGSLRQVFIVDPLTEGGRTNIRYVFYLGLFALASIPGAQPFAAAYGVALETIMLVAYWREKINATRSEPVSTIDTDALGRTSTQVRLIPPGTSWHPPDPDTSGGQKAEEFATLRDRIDRLERQSQKDRAQIAQLRLQVIALRGVDEPDVHEGADEGSRRDES